MHAPFGSPRFPLRRGRWFMRPPRFAVLVFFGLVLALLASDLGSPSRRPSRVETVNLAPLGAEVQLRRVGTHLESALVRACLYGRDPARCTDDRWLPIASLDAVAGRNLPPGTHAVRGCLYLKRHAAFRCEPHDFYLTLAEFR